MMYNPDMGARRISVWTMRLAVFFAASLAQFSFWSLLGWRASSGLPLAVAAAGLMLAVLAAWVCGEVVKNYQRQVALQQRLEQSEVQIRHMQDFLGGSLRMDTELLDAVDEAEVMEITLSVITGLTEARGASFVPLDEWGQPLPATFHGKVPPLLRKMWTEHLASGEVRGKCRNCQKLEAPAGSACVLADGPLGPSMGVYCFPLQRGERLLGMVNLYAPGAPAIRDEQLLYLKGLLNEAALAVETLRLRSRELAAMRPGQALRSKIDLPLLVNGLLESVQQVMEVDAVMLFVRDALRAPAVFHAGSSPILESPEAALLRDAVLASTRRELCPAGGAPLRLAGLPLSLPDGRTLGALLLASETPFTCAGRRLAILQSVADQAALLVENERLVQSLEYRTVIQERNRLAREIHDGLAQTLAFLKLQAAQMQGYLAQGNLSRLSQVLKQNYDSLAEAYLDTRQAIDALRLDPQQGLSVWLEQLLNDFETTSGLPVERALLAERNELAPEVQAQLMRIVQEALNNIRKHAHANRVWVTASNWNGDVVLEVRDDGQGFTPQEAPALSQYGLRGMHERAELIGADFQVISKPQQGTRIRISIPLHTQESPA